MKSSSELEQQAAANLATLMAAAARTAPKTRGIDNIQVIAIDDVATRQRLIEKMQEIARTKQRPSFARDANSIAAAPVIIVIGVESNTAGLNCGFCGQPDCESLEKLGGVCAFNSVDLGIATCSAAELAGRFHADNRLMYSIGCACLELGLFGAKVRLALGIPLSITGKSPFFDRKA